MSKNSNAASLVLEVDDKAETKYRLPATPNDRDPAQPEIVLKDINVPNTPSFAELEARWSLLVSQLEQQNKPNVPMTPDYVSPKVIIEELKNITEMLSHDQRINVPNTPTYISTEERYEIIDELTARYVGDLDKPQINPGVHVPVNEPITPDYKGDDLNKPQVNPGVHDPVNEPITPDYVTEKVPGFVDPVRPLPEEEVVIVCKLPEPKEELVVCKLPQPPQEDVIVCKLPEPKEDLIVCKLPLPIQEDIIVCKLPEPKEELVLCKLPLPDLDKPLINPGVYDLDKPQVNPGYVGPGDINKPSTPDADIKLYEDDSYLKPVDVRDELACKDFPGPTLESVFETGTTNIVAGKDYAAAPLYIDDVIKLSDDSLTNLLANNFGAQDVQGVAGNAGDAGFTMAAFAATMAAPAVDEAVYY